jgi:hypothetical protein
MAHDEHTKALALASLALGALGRRSAAHSAEARTIDHIVDYMIEPPPFDGGGSLFGADGGCL